MNLCLNESSIRIRLSEIEFSELKRTNKIHHSFAYWPLQVTIMVQSQAKISRISATQLEINIENSEVDWLILPDIRKSGLKLIAAAGNGEEITLDVQVDLHKNRQS